MFAGVSIGFSQSASVSQSSIPPATERYDGPGVIVSPLWQENVWQTAVQYAYISDASGKTIWSLSVSDTSCYFQQKMGNTTVGANLRICPGDNATIAGFPNDTLQIASISEYRSFSAPMPVILLGIEPYYWAKHQGYWSYIPKSSLIPTQKK